MSLPSATFLLLILTHTMAGAQAPAPTAASSALTSKVAQLDAQLSEALKKNPVVQQTLKDIFSQRSAECTKNPAECIDRPEYVQTLCKSDAIKVDLFNSAWHSQFVAGTKTENIEKIAANIKACPTSTKKLLASLAFAASLQSKHGTEGIEVLRSVQSEWSKSPDALEQGLRIVNSKLEQLNKVIPTRMLEIKHLSQIVQEWMTSPYISKLPKDIKLNSLDNIGQSLSSVGQGSAFVTVVKTQNLDELLVSDKMWAISTIRRMCSYYRSINQATECSALIERALTVIKPAEGSPEAIQINAEKAKLLSDTGKTVEAEKLQTALLAQAEAKKMDQFALVQRGHLARTKLALSKLDEAKTLIDAHLKAIATPEFKKFLSPQYQAYARVILVEILMAKKDYAAAKREANAAYKQLTTEVLGTTDILAWLNLDRYQLAALTNDTAMLKDASTRLESELKVLPDLQGFKEAKNVIELALNKQSYASTLNKLSGQIGPEGLLFKQTERVAATLAAKK